ncbi:MAG TPA: hypothetical protein VIE16_12335 [Phenylobacterium sp.]|jgi:hypothetical protein
MTRVSRRAAFACAVLAALGLAAGRRPAPAWTVFADCAAAYLANARVSDPGRAAAMTAQVSDVADDYRAEAVKRRRAELGGSARTARQAVDARVAERARRLGARPREAAEKLIDACPQVGG